MNLVDYLLENHASRDTPALLTLEGRYSYRELCRALDKLAGCLMGGGVHKGDRVLLLAENSFFGIAGYLAVLRAGGVAVPLSPTISVEELRYIIDSCGCQAAIVHGKVSQQQLRVLPRQAKIISEDPLGADVGSQREVQTFDEVLSSPASKVSYPSIEEKSDLAAIMFTSGSTGRPRGVKIPHGDFMVCTSFLVEYLGLTTRDRMLLVLPFHHAFGAALLHDHLRAGGALVLDPRFMFPDKVLARMQETQCTGFAGVPSHCHILLRASSLKKMRFPLLRYVHLSGGKLADNLVQELRESLPTTRIFTVYAQTESALVLSYLPPEMLDAKLGSIGKGAPGVRLQVLDEDGRPVSPGQVGQIVAECDPPPLGYWGTPAEEDLTFRNGRLYTGDLATIDADGYIFVVGRSKDFLKCGGHRVSCKEVEDRLLGFDGLVEAAVVGIPDDRLGEAVKAFVVPREKTGTLLARLQAFCEEQFPPHLIPKEIVVLQELPRSPAGKVLKPALKQMN